MVSQSDVRVLQKAVIDSLHQEGQTQKHIVKEVGCSLSAVSKHITRKLCGKGKSVVEKVAQATAALRGLSSQTHSRIWGNFTRSGLSLDSVQFKEFSHCLIPCVKPLQNRDSVRSILPGSRRQQTGLLLRGSKSSFQMKVVFASHF